MLKTLCEWSIEHPYSLLLAVAAFFTILASVLQIWRFFRKPKKTKTSPNQTNGETNVQRDMVTNNYHYGITMEEYEAGWRRRERTLQKEISQSVGEEEKEKRRCLEIEIEEVNKRLLNIEKSYEEEKERSKAASDALEKLRGELPEAKIEEAQCQLQSGNPEVAEKLFDEIAKRQSVAVALAAYQSGRLAEGRLDFSKAMRQFRKAVTLEESNPDYLLAAGRMAQILGCYREAMPWLEKLLQLREAQGKETPALAVAKEQLGWLYLSMGKYGQAESLFLSTMAVMEKVFGKEDFRVAVPLNNLALLYSDQGKCDEAERMYSRALKIQENVRGCEYPNISVTLNNLATLYRDQGKYDKAEHRYFRALGIQVNFLGKAHPKVAVTLGSLATLYYCQRKYDEAEAMYLRALAIQEKILGERHPNLIKILNNLALLYEAKGDIEKAESVRLRVQEIERKAKGQGGDTEDTKNKTANPSNRKL